MTPAMVDALGACLAVVALTAVVWVFSEGVSRVLERAFK